MDVYLPEDFYLIRDANLATWTGAPDEDGEWLGGEALVAPAAPFAASREQGWTEAGSTVAAVPVAAPLPARKRFNSVTDFDWRTL